MKDRHIFTEIASAKLAVAEDKGYCPGTGKAAERKGSKYIRYTLKYLCPDCGRHIGKDPYGYLNKHGYKLQPGKPKPGKVYAICAECGDPIYDMDYLCGKCRS